MSAQIGPNVGVVGAGYVGLTTAVCLAAKDVDTICVDSDPGRVAELRRGRAVIDEPDLECLLRAGLRRGALRIANHHRCLADRDVVFICVPTPTDDDGGADLRAVEHTAAELADTMRPGSVIAVKSTVPVGTCRRLNELLAGRGIHTVANPEFLRESHAVYDFCHPERVVIGAAEHERGAARRVAELYAGDTDTILQMSLESAELAKYASNAFLAVKLSFVNSLAELCGRVGAEIADVTGCMGADERIGRQFLAPGPGWGGSCLPKDTAALLHTGRVHGIALREVESARQTNSAQSGRITATLRQALGRRLDDVRITALGLTFKAGTSDIRDSPAVAICADLIRAGAQVTAYDPRLDSIDSVGLAVATARDPYVAAKDADAIVVLTEWPEFSELDWETIGQCAAPGAVVIDTRNILDRNAVCDCELLCLGNGTAKGY